MSVESLRKRRDVAWVEEQSADIFGPPAYDETASSYNMKTFKRGFVWGNNINKFNEYRIYAKWDPSRSISIYAKYFKARNKTTYANYYLTNCFWCSYWSRVRNL